MASVPDRVVSALREWAAETPLAVRIQGDCMAPLLKSGATVHIIRQRFYPPGDVVVVHTPDGRLLAHRLLGCYRRRRQWRWLTQADSALWPDGAVPMERVLGKVCGGECSPLLVRVPLTHRLKAFLRFLLFGFFVIASRSLVSAPVWRNRK